MAAALKRHRGTSIFNSDYSFWSFGGPAQKDEDAEIVLNHEKTKGIEHEYESKLGQSMETQFLNLLRVPFNKKVNEVETDRQPLEKRAYEDSLSIDEISLEHVFGYRCPFLTALTPKDLRRFKIELEISEDTRQRLNFAREPSRQIPRPEPRTLVHRKLWGVLFIELKKYDSELEHFLDATYDDLHHWLVRAMIQSPNNRRFLKRIGEELKQAWGESYFFGFPRHLLCVPSGDFFGFYDAEWSEKDYKKGKDMDPKKLSTTSSVTMFSDA